MKKAILAIMFAVSAYAQTPTLVSVTPGPWVGTTATTFTFHIQNPYPQANPSYYYFAFMPVGSSPVNNYLPGNTCTLMVTLWQPQYSHVQVDYNAGTDLTAGPTFSGFDTPIDSGLFTDDGPVLNSSCTVYGYTGGSGEATQPDGSLNISLTIGFNTGTPLGINALFFGTHPQAGNGGPTWSGPMLNPDGSTMLFIVGSVATGIGSGTNIKPYPNPPLNDYAPMMLSYINTTPPRNGQNSLYVVGDYALITASGPPNTQVSYTGSYNGVPSNGGNPIVVGSTDSSGNFTAGPFAMQNWEVGTYNNTWFIGGVQVGLPWTFTVAPLVTYANLTNPASPFSYRVGDVQQITIQGAPNSPVGYTGWFNGVPFNLVTYGSTDANGNWQVSFPLQQANVGTWIMQWWNGGVAAPLITFTVQ